MGDSPAIDLTSNKYAGKFTRILFSLNVPIHLGNN
jgi:hypothetical protein